MISEALSLCISFFRVISHVLGRPLTICYFLDFSKYFQANRDQHSIVANVINPPIIARFCRIIPRGWYRHISMRVEFYGCKAGIRNTLPYQEECSAFFTFSKEFSKLIWLSQFTHVKMPLIDIPLRAVTRVLVKLWPKFPLVFRSSVVEPNFSHSHRSPRSYSVFTTSSRSRFLTHPHSPNRSGR